MWRSCTSLSVRKTLRSMGGNSCPPVAAVCKASQMQAQLHAAMETRVAPQTAVHHVEIKLCIARGAVVSHEKCQMLQAGDCSIRQLLTPDQCSFEGCHAGRFAVIKRAPAHQLFLRASGKRRLRCQTADEATRTSPCRTASMHPAARPAPPAAFHPRAHHRTVLYRHLELARADSYTSHSAIVEGAPSAERIASTASRSLSASPTA